LCVWDEIKKKVVLKSESQLDSENALKQLTELDKFLPRPVEDQYDILITAEIITTASLDNITVYTDTTLLDVYNQKKALRATL